MDDSRRSTSSANLVDTDDSRRSAFVKCVESFVESFGEKLLTENPAAWTRGLQTCISVFLKLYGLDHKLLRSNTSLMPTVVEYVLKKSYGDAYDFLSRSYNSESVVACPGVDEESAERTEGAFRVDYRDPHKSVEYCLEQLDQYCKDWDESKYYAPYCSLVQSSGSGKSRMVAELSQHKVFVIYLSFLNERSSGFPKRSKLAYELQVAKKDAFQKYILVCLKLIKSKGCPKSWADYHMPWLGGEKNERSDSSDPYDTELSKLLKNEKETKNFAADLISIINEVELYRSGKNNLRFLFVFDEARCLLETDAFQELRRALMDIPGSSGVFGLFIDTASVITNLAPHRALDPSARARTPGKKLYPPIFLISCTDVFVVPDKLPQDWNDAKEPDEFLKFGRPLWASFLESAAKRMKPSESWKPSKSCHELVGIAKTKLSGGRPIEPSGRENISKEEALSVLGQLVCLDVSPACHMGARLVANHMRLCVHISDERDLIFTASGLDPALTEAALQLFGSAFERFVVQLSNCLKTGWVDAGFRGELAARICLIFAVYQKTYPLTRYLTVEKFLEGIGCPKEQIQKVQMTENKPKFPEEEMEGRKTRSMTADGEKETNESAGNTLDILMAGMVFFTGFVQLYYTPKAEDLLFFYRRSLAIVCKNLQQGIDLLIPILLPKYTDRQKYELKAEYMSCIFIQVKNVKNLKNVNNIKMTPNYTKVEIPEDSPYLSILLHLGVEGFEPKLSKDSPRQYVLVCKGRQFPFLGENDCAAVKTLLQARVDPSMFHTNPAQLQGMWPVFALPKGNDE